MYNEKIFYPRSFYYRILRFCFYVFFLFFYLFFKNSFRDWPTVPQVYIKGEFVGGCDIMLNMHQSGELEELLLKQNLIAHDEESEKKETDYNTVKNSPLVLK